MLVTLLSCTTPTFHLSHCHISPLKTWCLQAFQSSQTDFRRISLSRRSCRIFLSCRMAWWESCLQNTVTATCGQWSRSRRKVGQCGLDRIGHPLHPGGCHSSSQHHHPLCCYAALHGLILLQAVWSQILLWDFMLGFILLKTQAGGAMEACLQPWRSDEPRKHYELVGSMKGTLC